MANRILVLPIIGTGTTVPIDDPRRPKYLREARLGWSMIKNAARSICIVEVRGEDALIDAVAANSDVQELMDVISAINPTKLATIVSRFAAVGVTITDTSSERAVIASIREGLLRNQRGLP